MCFLFWLTTVCINLLLQDTIYPPDTYVQVKYGYIDNSNESRFLYGRITKINVDGERLKYSVEYFRQIWRIGNEVACMEYLPTRRFYDDYIYEDMIRMLLDPPMKKEFYFEW